jgi:disulfide oxidoreductase YuzD
MKVIKLRESDIKRIVKRILVEEDWENTGWRDEEGKVTIKDVLEYIGDNVRNISVSDLQNKLKSQLDKVTKDEERIMKADLQYPIILVQKDGEFSYVLDGNHRLAKAILTGEEYIKAKVLYLDDKKTPEDFKRLLNTE